MVWSLYLDSQFRDFNYCELPDPGWLPESQLFDLVDQARTGDRTAFMELGDILHRTLREAAFACYQAQYGPTPISYAEYFYAKFQVCLEVLLYEKTWHSKEWGPTSGWWEGRSGLRSSGPQIYPDDVEELFAPADCERVDWVELVRVVSMAKGDRLSALRGWLENHLQAPAAAGPPRRGWRKNEERDTIIWNFLQRSMKRQGICEELDKRTVPTLPNLQGRGIFKWREAWEDAAGNQAIQRLFSKVLARQKAVKRPSVSK